MQDAAQGLPADGGDGATVEEMGTQLAQRPGGERGDPSLRGTSRRSGRSGRGSCHRSSSGGPRFHFGSRTANPRFVEGVHHVAHVVSADPHQRGVSRTTWPWPDVSTTIARRSLTGSFAVLVIRAGLRPPAIDYPRTNTPGDEPRPPLALDKRDQPGPVNAEDQLPGQRSGRRHWQHTRTRCGQGVSRNPVVGWSGRWSIVVWCR